MIAEKIEVITQIAPSRYKGEIGNNIVTIDKWCNIDKPGCGRYSGGEIATIEVYKRSYWGGHDFMYEQVLRSGKEDVIMKSVQWLSKKLNIKGIGLVKL